MRISEYPNQVFFYLEARHRIGEVGFLDWLESENEEFEFEYDSPEDLAVLLEANARTQCVECRYPLTVSASPFLSVCDSADCLETAEKFGADFSRLLKGIEI